MTCTYERFDNFFILAGYSEKGVVLCVADEGSEKACEKSY